MRNLRVQVAKHDVFSQRLSFLKVDEHRQKKSLASTEPAACYHGISYHIRAAYGGKTRNGEKEKQRDRGERQGYEKIGRLDGY